MLKYLSILSVKIKKPCTLWGKESSVDSKNQRILPLLWRLAIKYLHIKSHPLHYQLISPTDSTLRLFVEDFWIWHPKAPPKPAKWPSCSLSLIWCRFKRKTTSIKSKPLVNAVRKRPIVRIFVKITSIGAMTFLFLPQPKLLLFVKKWKNFLS